MTTMWRRFLALGGRDRGLVIEAATFLVVARLAPPVIRYSALRRALGRWSARRTDRVAAPPLRVGWAVSAASRRLGFATCLTQALAVDAMLRRRGYPSDIRFGVRPGTGDTDPIEAHAWVESGGVVVIGGLDEGVPYVALSARGRS
jgi:hypothetical protein